MPRFVSTSDLAVAVAGCPGSLQGCDVQDAHLRPVAMRTEEATHGGGDHDPRCRPSTHGCIVNDRVHIGPFGLHP